VPLVKKLTNVGGSRAVLLPKPFLDQLALNDPQAEVELTVEADRIILTPHRYATDEKVAAAAKRMMAKHKKALERLAK
jgi:antitoxin component of MazEF toxin-antitoxin module